ncbi:hypothetical protein, partial [Paenibacillus sp. 32O-W]|uniref:hypothetical protein n=1 Tax=Paenibacillus sp. 32O-W TaxID=1695218 RepID=UPI001C93199B
SVLHSPLVQSHHAIMPIFALRKLSYEKLFNGSLIMNNLAEVETDEWQNASGCAICSFGA